MMTEKFDSLVAKMQSELEQVYYCALKTDMWSSLNYDSFSGITVHYWHGETLTLKSRVLDCSQFQARHTSEELAKDITKYLKKFNIEFFQIFRNILSQLFRSMPCLKLATIQNS